MKISTLIGIFQNASPDKLTFGLYGAGCAILALLGAWSAGVGGQGVRGGLVLGILLLIGLPVNNILPILATFYYAYAFRRQQTPNLHGAWAFSLLTVPVSILSMPSGWPVHFTALYISVAAAGLIPIVLCLMRRPTRKYALVPFLLLALFVAQEYFFLEILLHV